MKPTLLVLILAFVAGSALAAAPFSADYAIRADTLDAGGRRVTSENYSQDSSLGGIAGSFASGSYLVILNSGYIGQLDSVTPPAGPLPCTTPTEFHVTGGGRFCAGAPGVPVGLDNTDLGVIYRLILNSTTPVGAPVAGTGAAISFGNQTVEGGYSVMATNTNGGCTGQMVGGAYVSLSLAPEITYGPSPADQSVAPGDQAVIFIAAAGTPLNYAPLNYQWRRDGTNLVEGGNISGSTSATLVIDPVTTGDGVGAGHGYRCVVIGDCDPAALSDEATLCVSPAGFSLTGGGSYAPGGSAVAVGLSGSEPGVTYQALLNGRVNVGGPVSGTGAAISFGLQLAGNYTVLATRVNGGCTAAMNGHALVSITPGWTGEHVSRDYSIGPDTLDAGGGRVASADYSHLGSLGGIAGSLASGSYNVMLNSGYIGQLDDTVTPPAGPLPCTTPTIFNVTGGGSICPGGSGVAIGLDNTDTGVTYQLVRNGSVNVGLPLTGTGVSISFGLHTVVGIYSVAAANTNGGCTGAMHGSATVSVSVAPEITRGPTPASQSVSPGSAVMIAVTATGAGVSYQWRRDGTNLPNGGTISGATSATLNISAVAARDGVSAGHGYRCVVSGECTPPAISDEATLCVLPAAFQVTGGGTYFFGGSGVGVGLSGSESGVSYQLTRDGSASVGAPLTGTGSALSFGNQTAGSFTVTATRTSGGCSVAMNGSAIVIIAPAWAGQRVSSDYAVNMDVVDAGGGRTASADYANVGSVGEIAGSFASATGATLLDSGFIAQLGDVAYAAYVNHPPSAPTIHLTRAQGLSLKIRTATVLAACSDPDLDVLTFQSVNSGTNGAEVNLAGGFVFYLPRTGAGADNNDSLTYAISDGHGGSASGQIVITVIKPAGVARSVIIENGVANVLLAGIPGYAYVVQRSLNLETWTTVLATNAPPNGAFTFTDTFSDLGGIPPTSAFYRVTQP